MPRLDVSIHALLAECDNLRFISKNNKKRFNPRTPCGVRPINLNWTDTDMMFQSTHSLRSATIGREARSVHGNVSIHALLAECDISWGRFPRQKKGFNPRTPCGVRQKFMGDGAVDRLFQSTHSLRSATPIIPFWPKPPLVSIHALLAECDKKTRRTMAQDGVFQSTHSLRSATHQVDATYFLDDVSIHALLAECDLRVDRKRLLVTGFNPRTPCGVRPVNVFHG